MTKGKKQKSLYFKKKKKKKKCKAEPFWREETEIHHISLVAAITAGCTYLRSLCLSPKKMLDENIIDTFFNSWEKVGFELILEEGLVSSFTFRDEFKGHIREQVSHQTSHQNE